MRSGKDMHQDHYWRVRYFWQEKWHLYFPKHLMDGGGRKALATAFRKLADEIEAGRL